MLTFARASLPFTVLAAPNVTLRDAIRRELIRDRFECARGSLIDAVIGILEAVLQSTDNS